MLLFATPYSILISAFSVDTFCVQIVPAEIIEMLSNVFGGFIASFVDE
jgi:hypothetical protein